MYLWQSILKEVKRRQADPGALGLWVGIPLVIGSLMSLISGGSGTAPTARLLVVDQDDSFLSGLLLRAADGAPMIELERFDTLEAGRAAIDAGQGSALLLIPEGFGEAVFESRPTLLTLVENPAQRVLPGIIETGLEMAVEGSFYVQRLFANELATMSKGPAGGASFFPDMEIAQLSIQINERLRRLDRTLFPPVLELEFEDPDAGKASTGFNFGQALFPGMLVMSLLFIALGLTDDMWKERDRGTLRRLCAAPAGLWVLLASKIVAGALVVGAVALVGLLLGALAFELPLARVPLALAWSVLGGVCLLSLFFCLQSLASSQRGGHVIGTMVVFPLMMLGGSFFPYEAMPSWMVGLGTWTPNGQTVLRLKHILGGAALDLPSLLGSGAVLAGLSLLCFLVSLRQLRRVS